MSGGVRAELTTVARWVDGWLVVALGLDEGGWFL